MAAARGAKGCQGCAQSLLIPTHLWQEAGMLGPASK